MIAELKTIDGFSADLEEQLNALKPDPVAAVPVEGVAPTVAPVDEGLFDIKILNDIEDIKTRANLKKIFMKAKKASKNSSEVIPEMISSLESGGLLTDEIKLLLEGILK